jgi:two-component system, sensor histidine kinase and response regulator
MNDFVAKPIELNNFYASLIKWLPERKAPLEVVSEPAEKTIETDLNSSLTAQLEQFKELDSSIGLRNLRGDAVAYLRLLRLFENSHGEDIAKFTHYFLAESIDQARQLAHAIKGAAGTLGLTTLQEAAKLLEANLKGRVTPLLIKRLPDY